MARIVCFSDNSSLASAVRQGIGDGDYELHILPASRLSNDVRDSVRQLSPAIILMELTPGFDNVHLLFFLRSDNATRETPLILLAESTRHQAQAVMLGADGFVLNASAAETIRPTLEAHMLQEQALAA